MKDLVLAVGTVSEQKIGYVKELISEIGLSIKLVPVDVQSGVSSQPLTEEETKKGSINRAKQALENVPSADCGIGIEVGYHKNKKGNYEIFCYSSIIDKDSKILSCSSNRFLMPKFHQDKIKNNLPLGKHVRDYFQRDNHPATQYIAELLRGRKQFIVESVRNALLFYLKKEEFDF